MKRKMQFVSISLVWVMILLAVAQPNFAQHTPDHAPTEWKIHSLA
jgi:hypothetical protein